MLVPACARVLASKRQFEDHARAVVLVAFEQGADDVDEVGWVLGCVEGVGGEDDVEFALLVVVVVVVVIGKGIGCRIRPVERSGRDGAGGGEGCVYGDVVVEVWEDGREVGEVGCGREEGRSGDADEAGAGTEFEDAGTCGCRVG